MSRLPRVEAETDSTSASQIPIVIALKALGCQSDKEVLQLICGNEESFHSDFAVNLEDAAMFIAFLSALRRDYSLTIFSSPSSCRAKVFTCQQALDYVGARVKVNRKVMGARRPVFEEAIEALSTIVIAHVPVDNGNFRPKCIYVATMARRVIMAMRNDKNVDDRDYVGNKRLEL